MKGVQTFDVHDMFERIVPTYDFLNHLFSLNIDKAWRNRLIKRAAVSTGSRVLDVCTGTADVAIQFARKTDAAIVGVDFSASMLAAGKKKVEERGLQERIELAEGDAEALDFEDEQFDAVSVAFGLRNLGDREKGIYEMARVARKGGRILILEFVPPRRNLFGSLYGWYLRAIMPAIGGLISGYKPSYAYLYSSISDFLEPEQILSIMKRAGIPSPIAEPLSGGIAYLFHGAKD